MSARTLFRSAADGIGRWLVNRAGGDILAGTASRLSTSRNRLIEQLNPLRGLTAARAVQLAESMNRGQYGDIQWVFANMERCYPTLAALIERRTSAVVELDWGVRILEPERWPKGGSQAIAEAQQAALRELYYGIDNMTEVLEAMAMASFRGFAVLEKQDLNGDGIVDHFGCTDTWNWLRDGLNGPWYWNPELRLSVGSLDAQQAIPEEWFLIRTVPRPLDLMALPIFCRAALGEKDWSAFLEIFAVPGGVVIGPPNVPKDREGEYAAAGRALAEGGVGYLPNGSEYHPNNPPHAGAPFETFLRYWQEQLVLAGTGGQLTMLAESGSGTLAGGAHQETFAKIARAEGMRISSVLQRQMDKPELTRLFPGQPVLAYFDLNVRQSPTTKEVISDIKDLSAAGYQVDQAEVSEMTGYEVELKAAPAAGTPVGTSGAPSGPIPAQDGPDPSADPITNRAPDDQPDPFVDAVARSVAADLAPIREQLSALADITDPEARRVALLKFVEEAPAHARAILTKPAAGESIANAVATAYVNGLATKKGVKSGK